jgi:hypothetical protein
LGNKCQGETEVGDRMSEVSNGKTEVSDQMSEVSKRQKEVRCQIVNDISKD